MEILSHILKNDREVRDELASRNADAGLPMAAATGIESSLVEGAMKNAESMVPDAGTMPGSFGQAEAVVLFEGRPSLLIRNNSFALPDLAIWRERLHVSTGLLERVIPSVGRIELARHPLSPFYPMIGTAWLVSENVLATNRHVAVFFGFKKGDRFFFREHPDGGTVEIRVDFLAEHGVAIEHEFDVAEITHIEDEAGLDMAFLKIKTDRPIAQPIVLGEPTAGEFVATVGYPGPDPRVPESKIRHIFDDIYMNKRLAPGMIMGSPSERLLNHDCSTLKGSSGSVVLSLDTGRAVGLHFSGQFGDKNTAVNARQLKSMLSHLNVQVPAAWIEPPAEGPADVEDAPMDRDGYQPDYLGAGNTVPLPGLNHGDALELPAPTGGKELRYRHFSVVMHKERGLAICAAVNVDGNSLRFIPRNNGWSRDSRLHADQQHDNALYRHNDLDRGHLVRRLDPVWGEHDEAKQANDDTFFYTNAAPQHKNLNQRMWLRLEEHVLDNADHHDLKLSVFTGPVFDAGDPKHRGVPIPRQFWKIVAFKDKETGELRSSGYILDQSHLIVDVPEEFAFGAFKTFQVSVDLIARLTTIKMDELVAADVLSSFESVQKLPLTGLHDIVLRRPKPSTESQDTQTPHGGKISVQEFNRMLTDISIPESQLRNYVRLDDLNSEAFQAVITINEDMVESSDDEAGVMMSSFNGVSRWRRQRRYRRKIENWGGLRIVSEGDSWFQYPVLLDDVIDQLFNDYAVYSLGAAGDLLDDMLQQDELISAIRQENADACLISGGGNDLLGGGRLHQYLHPFSPGRPAEDCLNDRFPVFLGSIIDSYKLIFDRLTAEFPDLKVFCHGYDYAIPNEGRWLGQPLKRINYHDLDLQRSIIAVIIDRFHDSLTQLVARYQNIHHVDCRGAVHESLWHDELHPNNEGYRSVATRFRTAISQHV
ncbi:DNA/RNA non-specific endonuclease [Rhodopirellula bahusiensis]|uniref:DNA/RNA non-specific endonuclease n=4 Tax=Rhodopirellula bahusiensis TaxID=2014065 RepID=UPI003267501C